MLEIACETHSVYTLCISNGNGSQASLCNLCRVQKACRVLIYAKRKNVYFELEQN